MAALPYGPSMRKQRKWIMAAYGEQKEKQSIAAKLRQRETCIFLSGLMTSPDNWVLHLKRYAHLFCGLAGKPLTRVVRYLAALIVESVYGHRITSLDDPYVTLMEHAAEATSATGTMGGTPADMFPLRECLI